MQYFFFIFLIFLQLNASLEDALIEFSGNEPLLQVEPITKGKSNSNYLVTQGNQKYFVKVGNISNELFGVSMNQEWLCTQFAALHGLAPQTLYYSPLNRVMITEFIETEGEIDFNDPNFLPIFCDALHKLHGLDSADFTSFNPFTCLDDYYTKSVERGVNIPSIMQELLIPFAHQIEKRYSPAMQNVPCHLDLNKNNMLLQRSKLWLIDWEYGALSDPLIDLSYFVISRNLSDVEMIELLRVYLNEPPSQEQITKFHAMCFLGEVRESLWSFLQSAVKDKNECARGIRLLHKAFDRLENPYLRDLNY